MSVAHKQIAYPIRVDYVFRRPAFATFCPVDYLDVSGRPVLEGRSVSHRPSPSDYAICPYTDGRLNHAQPMNVEAIRNLLKARASTPSIISGICLEIAREHAASVPPTLLDLYRFAYICHKSPAYWALRYGDGQDAEPRIPSDYAAVSRFSHGLTHVLHHIATNCPHLLSESCRPEELYRYADENQLLIGVREVCAGPPKLIVHTIDSIVSSLASRPSTLAALGPSNELQRTLVVFGGLCHCMEVLATVYEAARCAAWIWRNSIPDGLRTNLHVADANQPIARHAIPYCFMIKDAARAPEPLSSPFISGLLACRWTQLGDHGDVLSLLEHQVALAREVMNAFRHNATDVGATWQRVERATVEAITAINRALTSSLGLKNTTIQFEPRELELFFGRRPFKPTQAVQ